MNAITMRQLDLLPDDKSAAGVSPHAPPMSLVRRAGLKFMALLHALDRHDPKSSRQFRKVIFADAGAQLTLAERVRFANIFRSSIYQRQRLNLYWLPSERHITSRAAFSAKLPTRRLPAEAIYIGTYEAPVHESAFLDDLDDLIMRIRSGVAINVPEDE